MRRNRTFIRSSGAWSTVYTVKSVLFDHIYLTPWSREHFAGVGTLHRYLNLPEDLSRPPSLRAVSSLPCGCSSIGYTGCDWTEVSLSRTWVMAVGRHHTCCLSASFIANRQKTAIGAERNAAHHIRKVAKC